MKKFIYRGAIGTAIVGATMATMVSPAEAAVNWGAVAVGEYYGSAWDYATEGAAMDGALSRAGWGGDVLATFANGCGAISYSPSTGTYWGGNGASLSEAQNDSLARNYGDAYVDYWACTSGHL